jgi:hypothetical protein
MPNFGFSVLEESTGGVMNSPVFGTILYILFPGDMAGYAPFGSEVLPGFDPYTG